VPPNPNAKIDMHVHVGVLGDDPAFARYGAISRWMRGQLVFRIMLLYAKIERDMVSDQALRDAVIRIITTSGIDQVVCLALDPVFDADGNRRPERSNLWVANEYITDVLQPAAPGKILLGASVHPYDPAFQARVAACVKQGAVLLKWLPSAQQIDLSRDRVLQAMRFLATAGSGGRPLPLLLHVGAEYAIMTTDPRTASYDFLSWDTWDRLRNRLRRKSERWLVPQVDKVLANIRSALDAGATIILAHCGLPYFAPKALKAFEHSDLGAVRQLLEENAAAAGTRGKCYADVSACVTPFRKSYHRDIAKLPPSRLLAGSDYPVPVFELSADIDENLRDFEAMVVHGDLERVVVPQDNLLDVNWRELKHAFGEHPMFRNANEALFG
jgi:predicted TIM-barrel fold metal-dependent hydrolase